MKVELLNTLFIFWKLAHIVESIATEEFLILTAMGKTSNKNVVKLNWI